MTTVAEEGLAEDARRLLADDTLAEALTRVRTKALTALAGADADDKTAILRLQQKVAVTSEILEELQAMILAAGGKTGGFNPNKPTE